MVIPATDPAPLPLTTGRLTAALLFLLGTLVPAAFAGTVEEKKLDELRGRIDRLQHELNETRTQRDNAREELRRQETNIGVLWHGLKQLETRIKADSRRLEQVRRQSCREQASIREQRVGLAQVARAAYIAGRQDYLKLLLSQDDPARAARVLTYYRYLSEARRERIQGLTVSYARQQRLEQDIETRARELSSLRAAQTGKLEEVQAARAQRAELLAGLNRQVKNRSQEIERLRADQNRLERLLGEIQSALPEILPPPDRGARFASLKGRLPPPARGHLAARFGESKQIGDLRWRGILLEVREGQEVAAVFRGRVVYADWLRGFGLLLILDHGDGYMTLYGHNQGLYRKLGDWVEAGEVIALSGSTGDAPRAGVYFELRHLGEPQDPLQWLATNAFVRAR